MQCRHCYRRPVITDLFRKTFHGAAMHPQPPQARLMDVFIASYHMFQITYSPAHVKLTVTYEYPARPIVWLYSPTQRGVA